MADASQVSFERKSRWNKSIVIFVCGKRVMKNRLTFDSFLVFSAPKYCDATENKGAYINIGPDLQLNFHKFDAVPHPDIKPMVRTAIVLCPRYSFLSLFLSFHFIPILHPQMIISSQLISKT